jgi:putative flippase GtrA
MRILRRVRLSGHLEPVARTSEPKAGPRGDLKLQWQIVRFAAVGTGGFVVNAGLVTALAGSIGPFWAQAVAFPIALSVTWWLNRRFTFGRSHRVWHAEWARYAGANTVGWLANNAVYFLLVLSSAAMYRHPALAVAAGSLTGMIFNFVGSKLVVFK